MAGKQSSREPQTHALYRFFGAGGTLLYIGITNEIPTRLRAHNKDKPWWLGVVSITIEHYPSRHSVLEAERRAIKAERPLYNEVHNPAPLKRRHDLENYLDQIRECVGEEELIKRVADERFMGTPEDLIPIEVACTLLSYCTDELQHLRDAVDELIAALPKECQDYLQAVIDHNRVSLADKDFQPGFLGTVVKWLTASRQSAGEARA